MKRRLYLIVVVPVLLALAACASIQQANTASNTSTSQTQANPLSNAASQPVEDKLAIGTLKLDGTAQAVTAAQAKTLLPLWKAVKTMSASNTTATAEMTALYSQIEDAMTAQQITAIKAISLSPTDMQKYGSAAAGSSSKTGSASSAQAQGSDGGPGGGGFGGPPDSGGIPGTGTLGGAVQTTGTPVAGRAGAAIRGNMNLMFVDQIITLLTKLAAS